MGGNILGKFALRPLGRARGGTVAPKGAQEPPSAAPQPPPARQPPRNPPAQPVRRPERPASKSDLLEVKELISRAGNYYSIARRDERKRGNYKKAYDTLRNAQKLLGRMTPTDEVRKMRSRVATQMLDVSKSLGFFDF